MNTRARRLLLVVAAVATGALLLYEPRRNDAGKDAPRDTAGANSSGTKSTDALQLPERRTLGRARGELFGAPPPPPQPVAAAAAAPVVQTAPPMPYRFAGRVQKGTEEEFLLSKGDLIFPVKEGDTLDGTYKVVAVKPDGIELVYLPLGTSERIAVSSALDVEPPRAPVAAAPQPQPATPVVDSRPARLRWDGPKQVQAGGNFTVALRVSTQEPLRAAPMQLRYVPEVLEPVAVKPGKFIGNGSFSYRVNPEGSIFVGATTPSVAPGTDAELLIVTFKPLKAGATAELTMSALSLQGAAGRAIAHEQPASFRATILQ
jgi:hypothetical protein